MGKGEYEIEGEKKRKQNRNMSDVGFKNPSSISDPSICVCVCCYLRWETIREHKNNHLYCTGAI